MPRIAEFECLSRNWKVGDPSENLICNRITNGTLFRWDEFICMKPKRDDQNTCYGDSGGK